MSLRNRRGDYSWPPTKVAGVTVASDRRSFASTDTAKLSLGFRIVGGLRDAFHPDVWTVAWEDFDKILRLTTKLSIGVRRGIGQRKLVEVKKEVRKASFYWSRDPDLPYRIWVMVMPEDGGPPKIPRNVEDAKGMMLDFEKTFAISASDLGAGRHTLVGKVEAKWPRKSFIEKGSVSGESRPVVVEIGSQ